MKYVIEIENKPFERNGESLYRASNFRSLVFDKSGLSKLEPSREERYEELQEQADTLIELLEDTNKRTTKALEVMCEWYAEEKKKDENYGKFTAQDWKNIAYKVANDR